MAKSEKNHSYDELLRTVAGMHDEDPEPAHKAPVPEKPAPISRSTARPAPRHTAASDEEPSHRRPRTGEHETKKSGKKKKKHKKHRSTRIYGVLIMLTLIFVISISLAVGIIEVGKDMLGIDGTETLVIFTIKEGETTADIAENLKNAGIIRVPKAFVYFTRLSQDDANFIAGDHQVSSAMAYETIISELTGTAIGEDKEVVDIMFPEGITLNEAAKKLEEANVCKAEDFLGQFNVGNLGYDFEEQLVNVHSKLKFNRMEGYLFPDTYTFYTEMEPDDVCRKIYVNFNAKMKPEYYDRMAELNVDLDKIITLASMIQAEAANESEMKDISSVFWNRLNDPDTFPKLQSDPTSKYVEQTIKPNSKLTNDTICDAYDTYICNGLPAGAIGNPGADAIEAALYPNETTYYYFYANVDTGKTYFASTLEEHNENIDMVRRERGEEVDEDGEGEDE